MKHIKKYNESNDSKEIRLEKKDGNWCFIEVVNGDSKNAKEISLSAKQRKDIEKVLNT